MNIEILMNYIDNFLLEKKGHIMHQVWLGTIPNKSAAKKAYNSLKLYRDSWYEKNKNWTIIEWNKDMCAYLVKKFFPEHLTMMKKFPYEIQRCDAVRYLILYRYGGWYIDMDYFCNRSFDDVHVAFPNDIYLVQSPNRVIGQEEDHISNSLMFSVPNHPFWKQVMIEIEKAKIPNYYPRHMAIMFSTGPGILNKIYHSYKYQYKVKSLPYKLFQPFGIGEEKLSLSSNKDVYAIHLGKGSWESKDSKFFLFLFSEWRIVLFISFFLLFPVFFRGFYKIKNK